MPPTESVVYPDTILSGGLEADEAALIAIVKFLNVCSYGRIITSQISEVEPEGLKA